MSAQFVVLEAFGAGIVDKLERILRKPSALAGHAAARQSRRPRSTSGPAARLRDACPRDAGLLDGRRTGRPLVLDPSMLVGTHRRPTRPRGRRERRRDVHVGVAHSADVSSCASRGAIWRGTSDRTGAGRAVVPADAGGSTWRAAGRRAARRASRCAEGQHARRLPLLVLGMASSRRRAETCRRSTSCFCSPNMARRRVVAAVSRGVFRARGRRAQPARHAEDDRLRLSRSTCGRAVRALRPRGGEPRRDGGVLQQHGRDGSGTPDVKAQVLVHGAEPASMACIATRCACSCIAVPRLQRVESLRDEGTDARQVERRELQQNVKLGPGGIREIEFIVQPSSCCVAQHATTADAQPARGVVATGRAEACRRRKTVIRPVRGLSFLRRVENAAGTEVRASRRTSRPWTITRARDSTRDGIVRLARTRTLSWSSNRGRVSAHSSAPRRAGRRTRRRRGERRARAPARSRASTTRAGASAGRETGSRRRA